MQQSSQPPSSESSQLISQVQNVLKPRIKANSVKIDEFGKQHIKKAFAEIQDAWKTLEDLQNDLSIKFPKCEAAVQFLSHLGVSHNEIMIFVFQQLKDTLLDKILQLNDPQLLALLKETVAFLPNAELKPIPMAIIQTISAVDLKLLIDKNYIQVIFMLSHAFYRILTALILSFV